eukprot:1161248-Pelagomonas_calceolata.AAC.5
MALAPSTTLIVVCSTPGIQLALVQLQACPGLLCHALQGIGVQLYYMATSQAIFKAEIGSHASRAHALPTPLKRCHLELTWTPRFIRRCFKKMLLLDAAPADSRACRYLQPCRLTMINAFQGIQCPAFLLWRWSEARWSDGQKLSCNEDGQKLYSFKKLGQQRVTQSSIVNVFIALPKGVKARGTLYHC